MRGRVRPWIIDVSEDALLGFIAVIKHQSGFRCRQIPNFIMDPDKILRTELLPDLTWIVIRPQLKVEPACGQ